MSGIFRLPDRSVPTSASDSLATSWRARERRPITVLHVEDCEVHEELVMRYLQAMGDIAFTFLYADSEDEAVALFEPTMVGLVILDDDLKQGTCRSVLTRLRSIDPYVPTIAMTGEDNREVALDLLRMGIDAHIGKHELDGQILAQRVRETMGRADARRVPPTCPPVEVAPATGFSSWLGSLGAMLVS